MSEIDPFLKGAIVSVAIHRRALRRYYAITKAVTTEAGLTPERYELLVMVVSAEVQGAPSTVSSLSQDLQLGQTAATELVKRAVAAGLIYKTQSDLDARVVHIRVTQKGADCLLRAVQGISSHWDNILDIFEQIVVRYYGQIDSS